jgi:hypothetical protein
VGGTVTSARNATFTETARTIDVNEFGSRNSTVYSTGFDASCTVEFIDASDAGVMVAAMESGEQVTVSGGAGGWSFPAIVTNFGETDPLDDVVAFTVELKRTKDGLR